MSIIFDDFLQNQSNTDPPQSSGGTWGPSVGGLATRTLTTTGLASLIAGGGWFVTSFGGAVTATDTYNYMVAQDFSLINKIILENAFIGGTYTISVNGGPQFSGTIEGANVVFNTALIPASWDNVTTLAFTFSIVGLPPGTNVLISTGLSSTTICVAADTMILMADGGERPIRELKRGDVVVSGEGKTSRIARILHSYSSGNYRLKIVKIDRSAFGKDVPNRDLVITPSHKLMIGEKRQAARKFRKHRGVAVFSTTADRVLPRDDDGMYSLYNLQFDHDASFVANGVKVESVPVKSSLVPLDRSLYWDAC